MAVVSLVLGLSSFCMVFLTGVPAIILGILSLKRIGDSRGQLSGTGHAVGGIASGAFGIVLTLAFLPLIFSVREKAAMVHSAHNMRTLTLAVLTYEKRNHRWPDSIDELKPFCKGKGRLSALLMNPVTGDDPGYEYVKPPTNVGEGNYTHRIIFYQLRDGDRDLSLRVGYLDARVAEYEEQHEAGGSRVVQRKSTRDNPQVAVAVAPDPQEREADRKRRIELEQQKRRDRDQKERERRERERKERERQRELAKPDPVEVALKQMEDLSKEWDPYHAAGHLQQIPAEKISPEQMKRARTLLVRMAESGTNFQRQRGTRVFAHFAGLEQVAMLEKLADAPDKENKAWGPPLAALFRLAPERGRAILNRRCDGFNYRSAVIQPLVELPSQYEDEFWPMLFDSEQIAKTVVIQILGRMGTERSIPELQEVLRNVSVKEMGHYKGRVEGAVRSIQQRAEKS